MNGRIGWLVGFAAFGLAFCSTARGDGFPRLDHSVEMRATVSGFGSRDSTPHAVSGQSASLVRVDLEIIAPNEFAGLRLAVWSHYPARVRKHRVGLGDTLVFTWLPKQDPNALVFEKLPNLRVGTPP